MYINQDEVQLALDRFGSGNDAITFYTFFPQMHTSNFSMSFFNQVLKE